MDADRYFFIFIFRFFLLLLFIRGLGKRERSGGTRVQRPRRNIGTVEDFLLVRETRAARERWAGEGKESQSPNTGSALSCRLRSPGLLFYCFATFRRNDGGTNVKTMRELSRPPSPRDFEAIVSATGLSRGKTFSATIACG